MVDHLSSTRTRARLILTLLVLVYWLSIIGLVVVTKLWVAPLKAATTLIAAAPVIIFSIAYLIRPRHFRMLYLAQAIVVAAEGGSALVAHLAFPTSGPGTGRLLEASIQLLVSGAMLAFTSLKVEFASLGTNSDDNELDPA